MEQSPPWEADSCSAGQEIPYLSRNTLFNYRVNRSRFCTPFWTRWIQSI